MILNLQFFLHPSITWSSYHCFMCNNLIFKPRHESCCESTLLLLPLLKTADFARLCFTHTCTPSWGIFGHVSCVYFVYITMCENCNYLFKRKFDHTVKINTIIIPGNCLYLIDDIDFIHGISRLHRYIRYILVFINVLL